MAIVSISKISHRRGVLGSDPMPQLSSAELGWAVDKQELYIGNGTLSEGAPSEGNTRVLTEHSNLIALLSDYTYSGPFDGAVMQTGQDANTPISRTFIQRFNDNVNVRSFGTIGNGIADDIEALERAVFQHYLLNPTDKRYWTTLYLPAGIYRISRKLILPSHVRLVGDGPESTIILMDGTDSSVIGIEKYLDPVTSSDVFPEDISLIGIGLQTVNLNTNGIEIGDAKNISCDSVTFNGSAVNTLTIGANASSVLFKNVFRPSSNISFNRCKFTKSTYGIATTVPGTPISRQDISDVVVTNSEFYDLFNSIIIGPSANPGFPHPARFRIINNKFDKITERGIHTFIASHITSGQNNFADVGNNQGGSPAFPCIEFGDFGVGNPLDIAVDFTKYENNNSIGDTFDRTASQNNVIPRIITNCLNSYAIDPDRVTHGILHVEPGRLIRLSDDNGVASTTGITFDHNDYRGAILDYQIDRDNEKRRTGSLELVFGETSSTMTETYTELESVGVVFNTNFASGVTTLQYVSTSEGLDPILSYSIRHLICPVAIPIASSS